MGPLETEDASVEIDARAGGRIASLRVAGHELLVPREADPLRWGCYPMAPFAGRVRHGRFRFEGHEYRLPLGLPPHAIHGTVWRRAWREISPEPPAAGARASGVEQAALEIDLGPDWPFPGRALQRFELGATGLDLRLEVHAEDAPFPASAGWHPWFRRELSGGAPLELRFSAGAMYVRDAQGIPTGERCPPPPGPWDDCFTDLPKPPELVWPGALHVCFSSSAEHWVVYDEPEHALCVEPQTGPPNALNLAPRVVAPGAPLVLSARIAWTRALG